jgi:peptidoglycan/LPS O-acetylase OafA/YrhL
MALRYRPEVDGMRAIAVLSVILFHGKIGPVTGGFLGVDVFFVISGFLITSLIVKDLESGTFSFSKFYERRARRILPALLFVLACSFVAAWLLLLPKEFSAFCVSLVSTLLFNSNHYFWYVSGYFDTASEFKPLLHTWSLAVEEQYYILFPPIMLGLWRFGRNRSFAILAVVFFSSLALSEWGWRNYPEANFFFAPTRAWELLAGALCSFMLLKERPLRDGIFAALGLALVITSFFWFDETMATPSLSVLPTVFGSALLLLFAKKSNAIGKILAAPPLVWLGLISFSAYLWHQPLFVFARILYQGEVPFWLMLALVVATFALAFLTWFFVEQPMRGQGFPIFKRNVFAFSLMAIFGAGLLGLGTVGFATKGLASRFSDQHLKMISVQDFDHRTFYRSGRCFLTENQSFNDFDMACTKQAGVSPTLIWGDSHAAALAVGLLKNSANVAQFTASGCPPVIGVSFNLRKHCRTFNDFVASQVKDLKPAHIILHARWELYKKDMQLADIENTIQIIHSFSPKTRITIVGGMPLWIPSLPNVAVHSGYDFSDHLALPNFGLDRITFVDEVLQEAAKNKGVEFISLVEALCRNKYCRVTTSTPDGTQLIAWDEGHLTEHGSAMIVDMLKNVGLTF